MKLTFQESMIIARKRKGLTQTEVAKLCGFTQRQVWGYEAGYTKPGTPIYLKICEFLNIDPFTQQIREIIP